MQVEFHGDYEFRLYEQSLENDLHIFERQSEGDSEPKRPAGESRRILLTDLLDDAQRTRNAQEAPYTVDFSHRAEVYTAFAAVMANGHMVDDVGSGAGHDPEDVKDDLVDVAGRLDECVDADLFDSITFGPAKA